MPRRRKKSDNHGRITPQLQKLAVPIADLVLDPANARRHDERNLGAIKSSLRRYGQRKPIVVRKEGMTVTAGNGTVEAATALGWDEIAAVVVDDDPTTATGFAIADNRTAELAEWDDAALAKLLGATKEAGVPLGDVGFTEEELAGLLGEEGGSGAGGEDPGAGDPPEEPVSQRGEIYALGPHRLMCGDSTSAEDVAALLGGDRAPLLHGDPPYGMGKEADGVENDNLYRERLDAFQMEWWRTWRPFLADNGSSYIWGNAPDLWRLWWRSLEPSDLLTFRNEIVWDKGSGFGQTSDEMRQYPPATERCLFFMLGEQGFNSNADNYWEGWEPIRLALCAERDRAGLTNAQMNEICGKQNMTQAAFTKGGFRLLIREDYEALRGACGGVAFSRDYEEVKRDYEEVKRDFYATRAHFDNTHDNMTDVWSFPRVAGEERHGHATPKPVDMVARAIKSSSKPGDLVLEPFAGSGTTLIAAAQTGRRCATMEITPAYCDVIRKRWGDYARSANIDPGPDAL
jgi:DNA modification methylase